MNLLTREEGGSDMMITNFEHFAFDAGNPYENNHDLRCP